MTDEKLKPWPKEVEEEFEQALEEYIQAYKKALREAIRRQEGKEAVSADNRVPERLSPSPSLRKRARAKTK
jgi:hypothetical protein